MPLLIIFLIKKISEFNKLDILKEPISNESINISNKPNHSLNVVNNLQHTNLDQSTSSGYNIKFIKDSNFQKLPAEEPKVDPLNNARPSCSHKDNIPMSVQIKTEPDNISNIFSQGTYRKEEDSVIVIYSSDEENNTNGNDHEMPNMKIILQQEHINLSTTSMKNAHPSTSKVENNLNVPAFSIQCHKNEIVSDDEDHDDIKLAPKLNSDNNIIALMSSSDSDSDYNSKYPKIIEPCPMIPKTRKGRTNALTENDIIIKTRAKSEKRIDIKKIAEKMTVDQNKQIIQERRKRLQELANKNNCTSLAINDRTLNGNSLTIDNYTDKPSTSEILKKKNRISRLQQNGNYNCIPSTSKSHLTSGIEKNDTLRIKKEVKFNFNKTTSKIENHILPNKSLNCTKIGSSSITFVNQNNYAYFDTLSRICKWNAVWLHVSY